MRIFLDDSNLHDSFYPLTTLKQFKELRAGFFSFQERWMFIAAKQNVQIEWTDSSDLADVIVPANLIPNDGLDIKSLLNSIDVPNDFIGIHQMWDLIQCNAALISKDLKLVDQSNFIHRHQFVQHLGDHPLLIHEKATMEHCFINTTDGPVIIDEHAQVMSGSMLRGPIYVGKNSVVKMGAQLYGGSNIGDNCTVGGEIKNAIFHSNSNKGHHGYIGDSYIGSWCNLGAGTTNSNIKNTAGTVRIWNHAQRQFLEGPLKGGVFMGDHVKTAINTSLNSGTVVSSFTNIFSTKGKAVPKFVPIFSWGVDDQEFYKLDNLLTEINRWMKMKNHYLNEIEKEKIVLLYKQHFK